MKGTAAVLLVLRSVVLSAAQARPPGEEISSTQSVPEGTLALGSLRYGEKDSGRCFSEAFLKLLAANSTVPVPPRLTPVRLGSPELFSYPFCLLSGEGFFHFTHGQREALRRFLLNGGFVLASAGCSSPAWDSAFREELRYLFPEASLAPLREEHVVYRLLFRCWPLKLKDGSSTTLEGLTLEGRTVLIYSKAGLNDTASLPDCCCCIGSEVVQSQALNANILLFALLGARASTP